MASHLPFHPHRYSFTNSHHWDYPERTLHGDLGPVDLFALSMLRQNRRSLGLDGSHLPAIAKNGQPC